MSVSALTTLAAVRDVRAPTKRDVGKEAQPQQDPAKEAQASLTDLRPNAQPPFTAESIAYLDLKAKPGIVPVGATAVFHLPQPGAPNSVWFLVTPTPKQAPKLAPARR